MSNGLMDIMDAEIVNKSHSHAPEFSLQALSIVWTVSQTPTLIVKFNSLSKITDKRIVTHDEYLLLLQNDNNSVYNYQLFDFNSLHETYLVKGPDSSDNVIDEEATSSDDDIVSSHDVEIENSTNHIIIENIFIKKFLGGILTIKDLNENSTVSQLKNKIYEVEGISPDDQCLIIGNIFIKRLSGETITFRNITRIPP
ncbi:1191_t:CDS:2 [Funneliformis mosseae]|uniref:1191_t:CDS:1 n=1 Tax=Funneliformis mosseae TaxID=27381 RepID=A0A9N9FG85_FUNMO|nr:1191_t:CDS:2 [Funneliformis mosseae]